MQNSNEFLSLLPITKGFSQGKEKSFKEFFSMVQNIGSDFEKFVQAKLPRGAKFEVTSVSKNTLELSEMTNE